MPMAEETRGLIMRCDSIETTLWFIKVSISFHPTLIISLCIFLSLQYVFLKVLCKDQRRKLGNKRGYYPVDLEKLSKKALRRY